MSSHSIIMISRHIDRFLMEGYTIIEIYRTYKFLREVDKVTIESLEQYGLGILPHRVKAANRYYEKIKQNLDKQKASIERSKEVKVDIIKTKHTKTKVRKGKVVDFNECD